MTRLTITIRDSIRESLMRHAFADRVQALHHEWAAFAEDVFKRTMAKNYAAAELFDKLPGGWFPLKDHISGRFGGRHTGNLNFKGGNNYHWKMFGRVWSTVDVTHRRVPDAWDGREAFDYDAKHPLTLQYDALHDKSMTLQAEWDKAELAAKGTLSKLTTVENAIAKWPEAKKFLTPYVQSGKVQLPALQTDVLNVLFHLPPETTNETDLHE